MGHELTRTRMLRWTAFGLVAAAYVLSFFHRTAPAALSGELQKAFSANGAQLGALAATYFYIYTLMQIPTGVMADTLGPRRIVTLGGLVAGAGSIVFALATTLSLAAAGRGLVGLGVSVIFVSLLKLNASWFRAREFATLAGLTVFLGNCGAVVSGAPLAFAITVFSWRSVFVAAGAVSILLAGLTWFLVYDTPGMAGLAAVNAGHARGGGGREAHWRRELARVVANPATWPGFGVTLGTGGSFLAFAGLWAVPYLTEIHGMARAAAANHVSLMLAGFAFGALFCGALSDRLERRKPVMIAGCALYALCWLPWISGADLPLAASYSLSALMGLASGGFTIAWSSTKEVNPPWLSGMATSVANTGVFLGTGIMQPLVGWVLDQGAGGRIASYRLGLGLLLGFALLSLVSACITKETYCRNLTSS